MACDHIRTHIVYHHFLQFSGIKPKLEIIYIGLQTAWITRISFSRAVIRYNRISLPSHMCHTMLILYISIPQHIINRIIYNHSFSFKFEPYIPFIFSFQVVKLKPQRLGMAMDWNGLWRNPQPTPKFLSKTKPEN